MYIYIYTHIHIYIYTCPHGGPEWTQSFPKRLRGGPRMSA